jgi:hypothetical protein
LGQAERLIADRVHNRLNPAEREEFFEQLARLRLTLADAADEAEARAAEEQAPARPAAPPVAQERLKEMALALATPEGAKRRGAAGSDEAAADPRAAEDEERAPVADTAPAPASRERPDAPGSAAAEGGQASEAAPQPPDGPRRLLAINRAGRLELPRDVAASAAQTLSSPRSRTAGRRSPLSAPPPSAASAVPAGPERAASDADEHAGNGAGADAEEKPKPVRRSRKTKAGLPEGWIIDEEGFVVPGPS